MIYCLYGDNHALDDKLREIMKKLNVDSASYFGRAEERPQRLTKISSKKEVKKMED